VQLKIKGVGKIQDSTIEMNGITAIAGENSTGKSTYGKVLYCMFNAFFNTKEAIRNERINDINRIIYKASTDELAPYMHGLSKKLVNEMENTGRESFSENKILEIIRSFMSEISLFVEKEFDNLNNVVENIKRSISIDDDKIQKIVISRYFRNEFGGQINHVNRLSTSGEVSLVIKGKNIDIIIESNECNKFTDNVGIRHSAIYMDTPFVMDDFSIPHRRSSPSINHRRNILYRLDKEHSDNTVIEEAIIKQKVTNILRNIHSVANGEFKEDKERLMFMENGFKKPIPLSSVSAGIKTFLIIRRLLELGEIKERDVLILDEPEIHLHPEWQLQFAKLLILLQKEFNLTILLTTHSPYFLNALEIYGEKLGIKENMNFYLAENNEDSSSIREVTGSLDIVYKQLAKPFQKLEDVAYED
jgi:predicted ATPase